MIVDTTAPVIELISDAKHYTNPTKKYKEEGFIATDNFDGDITDKVVAVEKDGIVTYTVSDSSGNTATAERTIVYKDVVPPVISLKGGETYKFTIGHDFTDPGFTAKDDCDGNLKKKVSVEGEVDGHAPTGFAGCPDAAALRLDGLFDQEKAVTAAGDGGAVGAAEMGIEDVGDL